MNTEIDDAAIVAESKNITRKERFEFHREVVEKVSLTYLQCRAAEPLGAMNWDSSRPRRGKTANSIHFIVDVEHAVNRVFNGREDHAEMVRAFIRAGRGFQKIGAIERRLIGKLGPALYGLTPSRYFVPVRQSEHRAVSAIPDSVFMVTANNMAMEAA